MSKERGISKYEGGEKHVQEVESEDEDVVLSRKEKTKGQKPAHDKKKVHHKGRPKGKNEKEKFTKDESHSEPEEVEREKSKRRKQTICNKEVSVKGYGDQDHYSDSEVCEKMRSKERLKRREVNTESESELSSDEKEMEKSSFEDDTSHNKSGKRKSVTRHSDPQKDYRNKRDAKSCNMQYSDEGESTKVTQKSESEEESSSASSSDEEETEVRKHTKKSKQNLPLVQRIRHIMNQKRKGRLQVRKESHWNQNQQQLKLQCILKNIKTKEERKQS